MIKAARVGVLRKQANSAPSAEAKNINTKSYQQEITIPIFDKLVNSTVPRYNPYI